MHIPERSESSSLINIIYIVCLRVTLYTCIYVYVQVLTLKKYTFVFLSFNLMSIVGSGKDLYCRSWRRFCLSTVY